MSKKENWKLVTFKGPKPAVRYAVSDLGRFGVLNADKKFEVRTFKPQAGVYRYNYRVNGESRSLFVYKEVAKAFLKKPSPRHNMIIRKDHDYLNDKASNLKWATPEEHKLHVTFSPNSVRARQTKAIVKSQTAKVFDEKKVREIKNLIWDPKRTLTYKQIAKKYKVSEMQIYRIKSGELWFHVKVENEPATARYKQNLKNLARLEKSHKQAQRKSIRKPKK